MSQLFFVIGAQRSGTTSFARWLDSVESIKCLGTSSPEMRLLLSGCTVEQSLASLRALAGSPTGRFQMVGEKATTYLDNPWLASELRDADPTIRIFAVLRNPVYRAVSHYKFSVKNGIESLPLEQALKPTSEKRAWKHLGNSTNPFAYLSRGQYAKALLPWKEAFPNLVVILLERLVTNPANYVDLLVDHSISAELKAKEIRSSNAINLPIELEPKMLEDLSDYYEQTNADLARLFGLSLEEWRLKT